VNQIEMVSIGQLLPYARNARTHDDAQVAQIAASIKEFGFNNPILIADDQSIVAGHGRLAAARKLGLAEVPVVRLSHLSDTQRKAYILADNRLALNAGWDNDLLKLELQELEIEGVDLEMLGFSKEELDGLLNSLEPTEGLTDEDAVPETPEEPITKPGDIWILGKHRLMCGDSTSVDAVDKLLNGVRPEMIFTDPPYNIDYSGVNDKRKIKNDRMNEDNFKDFLRQSLYGCETMYVCCSWQFAHLFREAMTDIGRKPKAMIVWDKVNPAQHLDKYYKQHELIWYYGDYGGHKTLRGDVWTLKRQKNTVHPTMKPVELIEMAINDQIDKRYVLDCFGGSGSTMIACEKTGRVAYLMELDPKYCDVIVKRWEEFTGKKAELVSEH
jgi:DNA modification methylase